MEGMMKRFVCKAMFDADGRFYEAEVPGLRDPGRMSPSVRFHALSLSALFKQIEVHQANRGPTPEAITMGTGLTRQQQTMPDLDQLYGVGKNHRVSRVKKGE
jgi:hypothetical protein